MTDLNAIMKQAQAMQEKLQAAQARMAETTASGSSGGDMVRMTLKGGGELVSLTIDPSLLSPAEGEILTDLIVAAHADAKRRLDAAQAELMREAAGPLGSMPGMPKLF